VERVVRFIELGPRRPRPPAVEEIKPEQPKPTPGRRSRTSRSPRRRRWTRLHPRLSQPRGSAEAAGILAFPRAWRRSPSADRRADRLGGRVSNAGAGDTGCRRYRSSPLAQGWSGGINLASPSRRRRRRRRRRQPRGRRSRARGNTIGGGTGLGRRGNGVHVARGRRAAPTKRFRSCSITFIT
jgi:hypothetical protein